MSETNTKPAENLFFITLGAAEQPVFKEARDGSITNFGESNNYPEYLLRLFDTSTKHGSIIKSKATYVAGKGWAVKGEEDPFADAFVGSVNRYGESLNQISKKCVTDEEIFGGYYLQIIWNNIGTRIAEIYHLDYLRVRTNEDNTQFEYRQEWKSTARSRASAKYYPAFNPKNPRGSQVLYVKTYRPGMGAYALPGYLQGLDYISADVEVGKHTHSNAQTGFSASKSITLVDGDPTEEDKKAITKKFQGAYSGSTGRKFILSFVSGADKKPIIDDLGASDLTKEDFGQVDELIRSNVFSCHQITSPALFGVATPGQLGQNSELETAYEIFKNTYVNDKQQAIEEVFNMLAKYAGVTSKLEIQPVKPLGSSLKASDFKDILPKEWVYDELGIDPADYPSTATPTEIKQAAETPAVNEHLKNMTGRQLQQVHRIVNQYKADKINRAQAAQMLRDSLAMSEDAINAWLGEALPATFAEALEDTEIQIFAEYGTPRAAHFVVQTRKARFSEHSDVEVAEWGLLSFAEQQVTKLQASILDLISKDKLITPEVLAETLKVKVSEVESAIAGLVESGALEVTGEPGSEERKLTAPLKELQDGVKAKTKGIQVRYSYEGPQDDRNRPFCAKLMELDRFYSRADIEAISQRLGYSVWDRRGGWYTVPGTNERRPYCRHNWMSNVVITEQ